MLKKPAPPSLHNKLFTIVVMTLAAYGCESLFEPELPVVDSPSFGVANVPGEDPALFGVTDHGELVRINVATRTATKIGNAGAHPDGLGFDPHGSGVMFGNDVLLHAVSWSLDDRRDEGCASVDPLYQTDWNGNRSHRNAQPPPKACAHLCRISPQSGAIIADLGSLQYADVQDIDVLANGGDFVGTRYIWDGNVISTDQSQTPTRRPFERASGMWLDVVESTAVFPERNQGVFST